MPAPVHDQMWSRKDWQADDQAWTTEENAELGALMTALPFHSDDIWRRKAVALGTGRTWQFVKFHWHQDLA